MSTDEEGRTFSIGIAFQMADCEPVDRNDAKALGALHKRAVGLAGGKLTGNLPLLVMYVYVLTGCLWLQPTCHQA